MFICKKVETYRADSEQEALAFLEVEKDNKEYKVTDYSIKYKKKVVDRKTGEIDEWYQLIIKKEYCKENDPYGEL